MKKGLISIRHLHKLMMFCLKRLIRRSIATSFLKMPNELVIANIVLLQAIALLQY